MVSATATLGNGCRLSVGGREIAGQSFTYSILGPLVARRHLYTRRVGAQASHTFQSRHSTRLEG